VGAEGGDGVGPATLSFEIVRLNLFVHISNSSVLSVPGVHKIVHVEAAGCFHVIGVVLSVLYADGLILCFPFG
jgi:hypothetical protein